MTKQPSGKLGMSVEQLDITQDMQTQPGWQTKPNTASNTPASWNIKAEQRTRPAYTARSNRLPSRTMNSSSRGTSKILVQNLQTRMLLLTLFISAGVLYVLGIALAGSGVYQAHRGELAQTKAVHASFQHYLAHGVKRLTPPPSNAEEVLQWYMQTQPPIENVNLLGFVDGKLVAQQGVAKKDVDTDQELLSEILTHTSDSRASHFSVKTQKTRYIIGVIPFKVDGKDQGILVSASDFNADLRPTINTLKLYIGISLLVAAILALINSRVSGSLLAPLRQMKTMMASISNQDDLSKRLPIHGDDDLAEVAKQANAMIARLQSAFEKERELFNDVGHELRTPLTIVRGHLELLNPNDPQETIHTRDLALGELNRMHRLTEDLVTVAKSDRADFIRPKRVEVADMIMDAFEHASQLGNYNWRIDEVPMSQTTADPQRLQQAILQLCQNATKFAPLESTIAIGAGVDRDPQLIDATGTVIPTQVQVAPRRTTNYQPELPSDTTHHLTIWVRDNGRGVEPKNQQRIFERFARVDHSLSGSGLGLSIVNAIAQAHRGRLQLRSQPGKGSVFSLVLPLSDSDYLEEIKGEIE